MNETLKHLLEKVDLQDEGDAFRRRTLQRLFYRMMESPRARELSLNFLEVGGAATVRFAPMRGLPPVISDGGRLTCKPAGFSKWNEGRVEIRLSEDYLSTHLNASISDLPAVLCHELFGHGTWYVRAEREKSYQALHHHELFELNARLVGWEVDFELDGLLDRDHLARRYLNDPKTHSAELKLTHPYYALSFSSEEMLQPVETLESRLQLVQQMKDLHQKERASYRSWIPVIEHFIQDHGFPEWRFKDTSKFIKNADAYYENTLERDAEVISEIASTLSRLRDEEDQISVKYLNWAASCPLIMDLQRETALNHKRLENILNRNPVPAMDITGISDPDDHQDQITFDTLINMYRSDCEQNPHHWANVINGICDKGS